MNSLLRPMAMLCTIVLGGLSPPALAQTATLSTADSKICCETPDGKFTNLSAKRCRAAGGWPVYARLCRPNDRTVCCKARAGYAPVPEKQCRHPTHARHCRQPPKRICCEKSDGSATYMMSNRCRAVGGWPGPRFLCKRKGQPGSVAVGVCCKTRHGYSWVASTRCRRPFGTAVAPGNCRRVQRGKICCKYPVAGAPALFGFMNLSQCKKLNGNKVANHYCLQPKPGLTIRNNG